MKFMFELTGIIIPPLPEKNVVQKYQMTTEFIETRRRALSVFLNRVVRLPCPPFQQLFVRLVDWIAL